MDPRLDRDSAIARHHDLDVVPTTPASVTEIPFADPILSPAPDQQR